MPFLARNTATAGLYLSNLGEKAFSVSGTATGAGSTTTIVDATRLTHPVDTLGYTTFATITFTGGTAPNIGLSRTVTIFSATTDTITFTPALPSATAASDTYTISIAGRPGPARLRLYQVCVSGTITSATTGLLINVTDTAFTAQNTVSKQAFSTPTTTTVNFNGLIDYGYRGVLIDVPGGIIVTSTWSGTGGTTLENEIVYDYDVPPDNVSYDRIPDAR